MIAVRISNDNQHDQFNHCGILEFGRAPQKEHPRYQINDLTVSRDHLRIEELPSGRVRLENMSISRPVVLPDGDKIPLGGSKTLPLPIRLTLGRTYIDLDPVNTVPVSRTAPTLSPSATTSDLCKLANIGIAVNDEPFNSESFQAIDALSASGLEKSGRGQRAAHGGDTSVQDTLTHWLETVIVLQQAAPGSTEFYQQTAEALVNLIGLDLGLVVLRDEGRWRVVVAHVVNDKINVEFSRTLLDHVAASRTTVYQDINSWKEDVHSLGNVEAVVASPIFGVADDVVGVLYGARVEQALARGGVQPLEAQLVQLLAATVGAHLARCSALRTRVQFEQFFSTELVRELERNPDLLEGRNQDVTVLFSDLRGFTRLSQRLGPQNTCRLVRDVMERLSERIVEYGGVIVDYAGDGILAMWNAPTVQEDHAGRACHAALEMLGELPYLNKKWDALAEGKLALGIGINTGPAQVGNTGSSRKFKYGPLGHTVNLASRVQAATKTLGLPVLITFATNDLLRPIHATRRLGRVRLPGVQDAVVLHELRGTRAPFDWEEWRDTYEQALTEYESGQWAKTCQTLIPLLQHYEKAHHHDAPTLKLLRRAGECLESRPDPFDPIIDVTTK
jgi:adenylate cyclase